MIYYKMGKKIMLKGERPGSQNTVFPQLFPDTRPGAPAGSVDKQAIINDLMQLTAESSPVTPVGAQKTAMRIPQSSEYGVLTVMPRNSHVITIRNRDY